MHSAIDHCIRARDGRAVCKADNLASDVLRRIQLDTNRERKQHTSTVASLLRVLLAIEASSFDCGNWRPLYLEVNLRTRSKMNPEIEKLAERHEALVPVDYWLVGFI